MNLREKIAAAILHLIQNFGPNKTMELTERFNREDMASLVCTTPEQVSRQLSDFEREKLIQKRGRKIIVLNPAKLKAIIEGY